MVKGLRKTPGSLFVFPWAMLGGDRSFLLSLLFVVHLAVEYHLA
jgi:hypothetical protein